MSAIKAKELCWLVYVIFDGNILRNIRAVGNTFAIIEAVGITIEKFIAQFLTDQGRSNSLMRKQISAETRINPKSGKITPKSSFA
jgi:hypothetical protein